MEWCASILMLVCTVAQITAQYATSTCDVIPNPSLNPIDIGFQDIRGTVTLTQETESSDTIEIQIDLSGFDEGDGPTTHGFHVHESGDIDTSCEAAGDHFNPFNMAHGAPTDTERHVGDLGNIEEDVFGDVSQTKEDRIIKFEGPADIIGRAIVIHETYDDFGDGDHPDSNTTGNAGPRLACCRIGPVVNSAESTWINYETITTFVFVIFLSF